jgi:hypothetical protein
MAAAPCAIATVPPTEAREIIATCRAAWGTVHASQSEGGEVDEPALTIYIASCEKLEELGYSVEGRPAELEVMRRCRTRLSLVWWCVVLPDACETAWVGPSDFLPLDSWCGRCGLASLFP